MHDPLVPQELGTSTYSFGGRCSYYFNSCEMLEEFDAQEILPNLYLGSWRAAEACSSLQEHNIAYVLSLTSMTHFEASSLITHMLVDVTDEESTDLYCRFEACHGFIEQGRRAGGILVHCAAGVSRSATIVISYLMKVQKMTYQQAVELVKSKRPCIGPNRGFVKQLILYEKALYEPNLDERCQ